MRRASLGLLALAAACARHAPPPPGPAAPEPPQPGVTVTLRWTAPVDLDLYVTDPALEITLSAEQLARLDRIWPGPGGEAPEAYAW